PSRAGLDRRLDGPSDAVEPKRARLRLHLERQLRVDLHVQRLRVRRPAQADLLAARPDEGELAALVVALDDQGVALAVGAVAARGHHALSDGVVALDDDRAQGAAHPDPGGRRSWRWG